MKKNSGSSISVYLQDELHEKTKAQLKNQDRSVSWLVGRLLRQWLQSVKPDSKEELISDLVLIVGLIAVPFLFSI